MNDKNFDSISQFSVPQSWIDGALNATSETPKKPLPFIRLTRTLAAVASIIFVCGIGVAVYFLTSDSSIPPVKPTKETIVSEFVETSSSTDENSEKETQKKPNTPTDSSSSHPEESENTGKEETNPDRKPSKPSQKPTKPTQKPVDPTQKPTKPSPPSEEPSEQFPDTPGTDPTEPPEPSEVETNPPSVEPTEKPIKPEAPTEPEPQPPWEEPTDGDWDEPTLSPYYYTSVEVIVDISKLDKPYKVYCKFVDSSGKVLGSYNLYDSTHRAMVAVLSTTQVKLSYYPYQKYLITKAGYYTYYFYNSNGEVLGMGSRYFPVD